MSDVKEYRATCSCGFTTNAYGTQQAANDALARHKQSKGCS